MRRASEKRDRAAMVVGALLGGWFAFWIVPAGMIIGFLGNGRIALGGSLGGPLAGMVAAGELVLAHIELCIAICGIVGAVLGALCLERIGLRPDWPRAASDSETEPVRSDD